MSRRRSRWLGGWKQAGIILAVIPALACSSSNPELSQVNSQLTDIQIELLKLQKASPDKDSVEALEATLQQRVQDLLDANAGLRLEIQQLTRQVEQLDGKLESTNFRLAQLSQQIVATNQELRAVRSVAEEVQERTATPPPPAVINPTDPRELYDSAYSDYLQGNYDLAILGFRRYTEDYGSDELADNATYWIGECYYSQGKFKQAIEQFDKVLNDFPDSDRTPSTLLRKGYAYLELGQRGAGIVQLQNVSCQHAGTDEAHLALQRLAQLGIDVDC